MQKSLVGKQFLGGRIGCKKCLVGEHFLGEELGCEESLVGDHLLGEEVDAKKVLLGINLWRERSRPINRPAALLPPPKGLHYAHEQKKKFGRGLELEERKGLRAEEEEEEEEEEDQERIDSDDLTDK